MEVRKGDFQELSFLKIRYVSFQILDGSNMILTLNSDNSDADYRNNFYL